MLLSKEILQADGFCRGDWPRACHSSFPGSSFLLLSFPLSSPSLLLSFSPSLLLSLSPSIPLSLGFLSALLSLHLLLHLLSSLFCSLLLSHLLSPFSSLLSSCASSALGSFLSSLFSPQPLQFSTLTYSTPGPRRLRRSSQVPWWCRRRISLGKILLQRRLRATHQSARGSVDLATQVR